MAANPHRYEHPFIPSLVNTGKELVLFDTGNGALQREHEPLRGRLPEGFLIERLRQAGYEPEDVDVVVITHGHPDHIGGLMKGGEPAFPMRAMCSALLNSISGSAVACAMHEDSIASYS
jgi:glyoxylase-like metal-dependent hydrolase (beta-lactamase superfamily II)